LVLGKEGKWKKGVEGEERTTVGAEVGVAVNCQLDLFPRKGVTTCVWPAGKEGGALNIGKLGFGQQYQQSKGRQESESAMDRGLIPQRVMKKKARVKEKGGSRKVGKESCPREQEEAHQSRRMMHEGKRRAPKKAQVLRKFERRTENSPARGSRD